MQFPKPFSFYSRYVYNYRYKKSLWGGYKRKDRAPHKLHQTENQALPKKMAPPYFVNTAGIPSNFVTKHLNMDLQKQELKQQSLDRAYNHKTKWPLGITDGFRPHSEPYYRYHNNSM